MPLILTFFFSVVFFFFHLLLLASQLKPLSLLSHLLFEINLRTLLCFTILEDIARPKK